MLFGDGIGGGVNRFATLETYCDEGDGDRSGDAVAWPDFDFAFYAWL